MLLLLSKRIFKVKIVQAKLIRGDHTCVIRHLACDPVMSPDRLQPPYFILIIKRDSVGFIGSILFKKRSQAKHTFSRAVDIRQHQDHKILLAEAAGNFLFAARLRLFVFNKRVGGKHPRVRGDRLGRGHSHIGLIDPRCRPDPVLRVYAGAGCIAHRIFGKLYFHVREHALVALWLILGLYDYYLFHIKMSVVRAGDHGRTVVGSIFSDQNGCAGHQIVLLIFFIPDSSIPHFFSCQNTNVFGPDFVSGFGTKSFYFTIAFSRSKYYPLNTTSQSNIS